MFGGVSGFGGMFGGGGMGKPDPFAGMNNPYGGGGMAGQMAPPQGMPYQPAPSMDQRIASQPARGARGPQGPIPPHIQAMLAQMQAYNANPAAGQYPGVVPPQPGQTQAFAGSGMPQQQMPQGMPQNFAGILSGLMGGQGFGPQMRRPQQAQQMPRAQPMQRARQPQRQPRLQSGPSGGNVLF